MVVRSDGEVMYSGQLSGPDDGLRFAIRDVARRGTAPTNVEGRLTDRGVGLDLAIPFRTRLQAGTGEPITPSQAAGGS